MGYNPSFYEGADYGFDPNYGSFLGMTYRSPLSQIGMATDARTADQLRATSDKISTGARVAEIQLTMPEVSESIPNQHLEELNRLRKLTGTEFTVHGALIEPTGVGRDKWNESSREQAERQMWISLQRAHKVDPTGNVVVTFHSSNGLPDPEVKAMVYDKDKKKEVEKTTNVYVIDQRTGDMGGIPLEKNYLTGEEETPEKRIDAYNKKSWLNKLQNVNFEVHRGSEQVESVLRDPEIRLREILKPQEYEKIKPQIKEFLEKNPIPEMYGTYIKNPDKYKKALEVAEEKIGPEAKEYIEHSMRNLDYGNTYLRDAYQQLQDMYNQAYEAAKRADKKEDLKKLDAFAEKIKPKLDYMEDPSRVHELSKEVGQGLSILRSIVPETLKPLKEFAIDKASETFSNLAFKSYKEFKDKSPIISIENPPAGSGLNRADQLKELVEESQKKFIEKASLSKSQGGLGLSKEQAKREAEKILGVTWDVGHINMIRKYGYGEKELEAETEKVAKLVKHVHLSDNFGMEHTELPMGMGNVPTKKHMEILDKYNKQVKKIVETGQWYQHFKTPPFVETLAAFGSPVYGMKMAPYWNQVVGTTGGYFAGYGMNPEIHHSIYGSGFANLPVELGGQMAGKSRVSGAPIE